MIQRFSIKKIGKYTVLLFIVFLFYLFPNKVNYDLDKEVSKDFSINYHDIFLFRHVLPAIHFVFSLFLYKKTLLFSDSVIS